MHPASAPFEMLFLRDFRGFAGGHLKVRDYVLHTASSGWVVPLLHLTQACDLSPEDNLFDALNCAKIDRPRPADGYFLAGEDWFALDAAGIDPRGRPVVNLIQGLRHADPAHRLFSCLSRPALRLCVSRAVADAIAPHANGPVQVMPTAVELPEMPLPPAVPCDVLIAGAKAPELAAEVATSLPPGLKVDLLCGHMPRPQYLARIASARVAVLLPLEREGFFLPPLEAMHLSTPVVTTDCGGGRDHCLDRINCLVAPRDAEAIAQAVCALLADEPLRERLAQGGRDTAAGRTFAAERRAYLDSLVSYLAP